MAVDDQSRGFGSARFLVGEDPQPNFSASPKPMPPPRRGQRSLLRQVH